MRLKILVFWLKKQKEKNVQGVGRFFRALAPDVPPTANYL